MHLHNLWMKRLNQRTFSWDLLLWQAMYNSRSGFALSKRPHLHRAYLVTECRIFITTVSIMITFWLNSFSLKAMSSFSNGGLCPLQQYTDLVFGSQILLVKNLANSTFRNSVLLFASRSSVNSNNVSFPHLHVWYNWQVQGVATSWNWDLNMGFFIPKKRWLLPKVSF